MARPAPSRQPETDPVAPDNPLFIAPNPAMLALMMNSGKALRAGLRMLLVTLVIVIALWFFGWVAWQIGALVRLLPYYLAALWVAFALFTLYFFRDPDPVRPSDPKAIVAPGHGKVDAVDEITESEVMGGPCKRISIFLSVFDVHVQNAPVHGRVCYLRHNPGQFLNAMRADSAQHNENVLIGFEPVDRPSDKVGVRLIAGLIARRIIPWIRADEVVPRSERISLIQFGSRADLYLPRRAEIKVKLGDKVVGGQTIVATFP
jgi:phosphatidylserine decarboxylase